MPGLSRRQFFGDADACPAFKSPADGYVDTLLILATTNGEIDLERALLSGAGQAVASNANLLLARIKDILGVKSAVVVSSACASASVACACAARAIKHGSVPAVLVVAADCVSEFVFSGFSSLMALDPSARPFDASFLT